MAYNAHRASAVRREATEIVSLSEALFRDGYKRFSFFDYADADNLVALAELDTADASCRSAHNARVVFVKADCLALSCRDDDIARSRRFVYGEKLVALVKVYGNLSALALIFEVLRRSTLDDAFFRYHNEILLVLKAFKRYNRRNLFSFCKLEHVYKVRTLCRARRFGNLICFFHIYLAGGCKHKQVAV